MGEALRSEGLSAETTGLVPPTRILRPRRRVFVKDVRDNGHYLRATWHPEGRMFVVSTWRDEVCTGAVRLPVEASAELASLIVDGMSEALTRPPRPAKARGPVARLEDQLRRWAKRTFRSKSPRTP